MDQLNHVLARQVSTSNDVNHSITFSGVGILPFGRGRLLLSNAKRIVDTIVNGWEISPLYACSQRRQQPVRQRGNGPVARACRHAFFRPGRLHQHRRGRSVHHFRRHAVERDDDGDQSHRDDQFLRRSLRHPGTSTLRRDCDCYSKRPIRARRSFGHIYRKGKLIHRSLPVPPWRSQRHGGVRVADAKTHAEFRVA